MQWKVVHFMLAINGMHAVLRVLLARQNKFIEENPPYQILSLLRHITEILMHVKPSYNKAQFDEK